jgi:hypothetical protein
LISGECVWFNMGRKNVRGGRTTGPYVFPSQGIPETMCGDLNRVKRISDNTENARNADDTYVLKNVIRKW